MSRFNVPALFLVALVTAGGSLAAQDAPALGSFKLGIGSIGGDVKKSLESGGTFSFSLEGTYPLNDRASLVGDLGFRFYSGANKLLSFIPVSVPATGVNPTLYETRNRRLDAKGFELTGLYRFELWPKELYLQGGLRLASLKTSETDTGTQLVTDGTAIANTGSISNSHILAVNTIASNQEKKTLAVGPVVGVGYRFLNRYAAELNAFTTKIETPSSGAKNGFAAELSFSVQF
jgi:hypothetical protein